MRVFKRRIRQADGTIKESVRWYIELHNTQGEKQRFAAFHDREATDRMARMLYDLMACRTARKRPDKKLRKWLADLPNGWKKRLIRMDIVDSQTGSASMDLSEHLQDYQKWLLDRKYSPRQIQVIELHVRSILKGIEATSIEDVRRAKVERYLATRRSEDKRFDTSASHRFLKSFEQFLNWMVHDERILRNPFKHSAPRRR
ncbi:MAG: hypothetical protein JSU63_20475 [Phycisphaerales bacterium]|nr:MAG: hypothetical protein JSU63_20475 [Phycisphaerales bacterium]